MSAAPYRLIQFGQQVGIGVAGSYYAQLSAVAKHNSGRAPYCLPNELICAGIARFLCLPAPPCCILHAPAAAQTHWFASLDFNLAGISLPPIDPAACVAQLPSLSWGVLLFDVLMANPDRHRGNLSLDTSSNPPRLSLFDHSHALFGAIPAQGSQRLLDLRDALGLAGTPTVDNTHCLLDALTSDDDLGLWSERLRQLPDFYIEDACRSATGLGITDAEAQDAIDFIKHRRDNHQGIIETHRHEFRGIQQWSLFP